jgi:DNA-directed RNA polymerase subunit RPC12/RpoP
MFYQYVCEICSEEIETQQSPNDPIPKAVDCPSCDGKKIAKRNYRGSIIHIPESFKATSWDNDDNNPTSVSHLSRRLQHSHPSGREGPIYHQVPEMHIHGEKE